MKIKYKTRQLRDFQEGDRVMVTDRYPTELHHGWVYDMDSFLGEVHEITGIENYGTPSYILAHNKTFVFHKDSLTYEDPIQDKTIRR